MRNSVATLDGVDRHARMTTAQTPAHSMSEVDQDDIRVFPHSVENDLLAVGTHIEGLCGSGSLATDNQFSPNFGLPTVFMDPRRAMVSMRLNVGH